MPKVAISYGHGENTWEDKRSKGLVYNGQAYEEHTFNASVGEIIRKGLEAHGVQVLVVQPPMGKDVPLAARINQANYWKADIYWSIHANAGAPTARGLCGFYWKGSSAGLRLAQLYAKYCKAENFPVYSGDYMYPSEPGTWSDFAELRETNMPALLTENGFMTNLPDADPEAEDFELIFLNKENFHNRLAYAHIKAILEYFGIAYDPYKSGEKVGADKPMRLFNFYTGGYSGEALVEIHDYVKKTGWDFSAEINVARDVAFTIGVFGEGTEAAANFEKWLTDRRFAFQKRYKE